MDLSYFLDTSKPSFMGEPCLYIIKHPIPTEIMFRCGASGTKLHKEYDPVYGSSEDPEHKGIAGRVRLYLGFWFPMQGQIYAALRIERQLVAQGNERTSTDVDGNVFNVNKGNKTLVLAREKQFHIELDKKGYRRSPPKGNEKGKELFTPKSGNETDDVKKLIDVLRTIKGEELFLFTKNEVYIDQFYKDTPKVDPKVTQVVETQQRRTAVDERTPTDVRIKLSKESLEQLRSGTQGWKFNRLVSLVLNVLDKRDMAMFGITRTSGALPVTTSMETKKRSKTQIDLMRNGDADEIVNLIQPVPPSPTPARNTPTLVPPPPPPPQTPERQTRVTRQMAAQLRQLEDEPIGVRLRNRVAGRAR